MSLTTGFGRIGRMVLIAIAASGAINASAQVKVDLPAGFHAAAPGEVDLKRPAAAKMQPRPAPLADADLKIAGSKLGLRAPIKLNVDPISTKYQLEMFSNSYGAEVDTTSMQDGIFYGGSGYVEIDVANVISGKQYLLDCSLGQNGTYKVGTAFSQGSGGTGFLAGTLSSFNQHLMIPLNPVPNGMNGLRVVVNFSSDFEFYGCQVDTVG